MKPIIYGKFSFEKNTPGTKARKNNEEDCLAK